MYSLIGLIEILLTVWALIAILKSGAPTGEKLIWVLVVILLPLVGFLLWYLLGPGTKAPPWKWSSAG